MVKKKILYNYWGYLSDKIGISSPDGNASYTPWILQDFMKRDWEVFGPPIDRDEASIKEHGMYAFNAFSKEKRNKVYRDLKFVDLENLPDKLDILFLEWRFPTKDNQRDKDHEDYSPDMEIQNTLLERYRDTNTKLVVFDLDYQLNANDEQRLNKMGFKDPVILETALFPKKYFIPRKTVFIPFDFEDMNQFPTLEPSKDKRLVYVGNNYNREIDFGTKLIPYSNKYPGSVHLVGNWLNSKNLEFRAMNPNVTYHGRIGFNEFQKNINDSVAVPLLATEDYKNSGYMTMRLLETLLFGSIPVGFSDFRGISQFLPDKLIVDMDDYEKSMDNVMNNLVEMTLEKRDELRQFLIGHLANYHDASNFVNTILGEKNAKI